MAEPMTSISGPFSHYRAAVDGYQVPFVELHPLSKEDDGMVNVVISDQCIMADMEEVKRWMPILAIAMARAAGYSTHGEHSKKVNPFKVQMAEIKGAE